MILNARQPLKDKFVRTLNIHTKKNLSWFLCLMTSAILDY